MASGGLDKRINIWDLEKKQAQLTIQVGSMNINNDHPGDATSKVNERMPLYTSSHCFFSLDTSHGTSSKSSIYAMAVNPSGTLLVTGSPEKVTERMLY